MNNRQLHNTEVKTALEWVHSVRSNSFVEIDGVPYTTPEYSRNQVKKAGSVFIGKIDGDIDEAETILGNWRSSHSYPLQRARIELRKRTLRYVGGFESIVVQRLKRRASIKAKLVRFPRMKLPTMQDIAGCRAIVGDLRVQKDLVDSLLNTPPRGFKLIGFDDYILEAKPDGYRSSHLIYEYEVEPYNGLNVEIQVRSQLQHAWATAVEVVSVFTNQNLKAGIGDDLWKRFFYLASGLLASWENPSVVSPTESEMEELVSFWSELNIAILLKGCLVSVRPEPYDWSESYPHKLMLLDTVNQEIQVHGFKSWDLQSALAKYDALERENEDKPNILVLLVTGASVTNLKRAYPNFYLDTTDFLEKMIEAIDLWKLAL